MAPFDEFPPEILAAVLGHVHPRQLVGCRCVSRLWRGVVDGAPSLQYTLELWRSGLLANTSRTPAGTPSMALARLTAQRAAWREMQWAARHVVKMQSPAVCRAYELAGGVFALQESVEYGGKLHVVRLAQLGGNEAVWTGTIHEEGLTVEDFAMDAAEDLLAVFYSDGGEEGTLALRSLSQPTIPHSLAAISQIGLICRLIPNPRCRAARSESVIFS
ncbi:hypothetical protein MIND_01402900 [Mycena indigotica]|uniref:F-box domain-containing protein n=1 Tax=Mycena indigotica TaxID=2126181 RepID=A0A8H6VR27_9AGAR|nr:uncharacterized protein MIND_01402900 [Mycena indigotica]KAF7288871.1 hypothetical protein MIND_01402900 [Mycena indigotica]